MRQLPIPYSEVMVKSLLQNLKQMTRRTKGLELVNQNPDDWEFVHILNLPLENRYMVEFRNTKTGKYGTLMIPFSIGDQLYVKETYTTLVPEHFVEPLKTKYVYKADCDAESEQTRREYVAQGYPYKWITGRFMPKVAARIWLEVTDIKCERLQSISHKDCIAEGILPLNMSAAQLAEQGQRYFDYSKPKQHFVDGHDPFWSFNSLWCRINGGDSWEANPWVFAYTFKQIEPPTG